MYIYIFLFAKIGMQKNALHFCQALCPSTSAFACSNVVNHVFCFHVEQSLPFSTRCKQLLCAKNSATKALQRPDMYSGPMQLLNSPGWPAQVLLVPFELPIKNYPRSNCHDRVLDHFLCWASRARGHEFDVSIGVESFVDCSAEWFGAVGGYRRVHYRWFHHSGIDPGC